MDTERSKSANQSVALDNIYVEEKQNTEFW